MHTDETAAKKADIKEVKLEPIKEVSAEENDFFFFPTDEDKWPRDLGLMYQCERCLRGFETVQEYRLHFHRHDLATEDYSRAFLCTKCMGFEAGSMEAVKSHDCGKKRLHDVDSKFTYFCPPCSQQFRSAVELHKHFTDAHAEDSLRRYHCPACGYATTNPGTITQHTRRMGPHHDGSCAQCPLESRPKFQTWGKHWAHIQGLFFNSALLS